MSESKIVLEPQSITVLKEDFLHNWIPACVGIVLGSIHFGIEATPVHIAFVLLIFFLQYGWFVAQKNIFGINKIELKGKSVYISYFLKGENKSFPRSDMDFTERPATWLGLKKRIDVYVNGSQYDTIDPRFDIDAIIAHPEIDVERA